MKYRLYSLLFALAMLTVTPVFSQKTGESGLNDTTYMLTYDHGGLILWGSSHFKERLRNAISWLDKYPGFKIGLDNEAQIYDYFAISEPSMLKELVTLLRKYKGRFSIGSCTYGQPLSQFINDESNIRQFSYALDAERKYFNYRPLVYLMSEHAMHSQIPQILNGFGFKGAIMRTHYMMYGYNPVFDVPIGWWKGIDDSKIATVPTYPGEGASFGKTTMDNWILTRYPGPDSRESMEAFRRKFEHITPLLASRADDSGLRKEDLVKEYENKPYFKWILLDELLEKYPVPSVVMSTAPNDFTVRMPWGYCGNSIWNDSRKAEVSVLTAERLAALEFLNGGESYEDKLDESWKDLLVAQHHDIQICGLLSEARKFLPSSISSSEQVIKSSMAFFAGNMNGGGFLKVTVFNPLSWDQSRWIEAGIKLNKGDASNLVAKCGDRITPVSFLEANRASDGSILSARIVFKADLPPLSLVTFSIMPAYKSSMQPEPAMKSDEKNQKITTPFYEVRLSEEGGVNYIRDNKNGEPISLAGKNASFFEGRINGVICKSKGRWIIMKSAESTPIVRAVEHGFIADIPYRFEMVFYEDNPRIDCKVMFEFNGQKIGLLSDNPRDSHSPFIHEEKLRFKFFPALDSTAAGIRDLPFVAAETKDKYIEGNYWTAISDGKAGVAFFNKGTMGSIREKDNSLSIPLAYSMYYIWGTRMLYGSYNYEFAIYPFKGIWHSANLHKRALEYSFGIPALESNPSDGRLGNIVNSFRFSADEDVILTALYPVNGTVTARFYKAGDRSSQSSLRFMKPTVETDLDRRVTGKAELKTDFNPWQIKTFQIVR